jgi:SRSO17 transposase
VKAYLVALPSTATLRALVRLAHHRSAIEQQYLELKDELGLDHFEGRSFPGWHRHVLLTALAFTWLQYERRRTGARLPSLPGRMCGDHRSAHRPFLRHAFALLGNHDEIQGFPSADLTK